MANILVGERQDFCFVRDRTFGISLIARNILDRLDFASLKSMRLVSKLWREMASDYILEKEICRVEFKNKKESPSFATKFKGLLNCNPEESKEDFPIKVPSSEFIFSSGELPQKQLEKFLSIFGQQIKKLSLDIKTEKPKTIQAVFRTPNSSVVFQRYLRILCQSPNLEQLTIGENYVWLKWSNYASENLNSKNLISMPDFSRLRKLILIAEPEYDHDERPIYVRPDMMTYKIIMAASNLTCVENLKALDLAPKDDIRKFQLIKSFFAYRFQPIEALEAFADFKPKLEVLSLADFSPPRLFFVKTGNVDKVNEERFLSSIYRILESSFNTLQHFFAAYLFRFPDPRLPILQNVHTLTLCINSSNNICHYFNQGYLLQNPQAKDLQEKLPNLKTLRLEFGNIINWDKHLALRAETWKNHGVQFKNNLCSVENLEIRLRKDLIDSTSHWYLKRDSGWMEMMRDLFPSIKKIVLQDFFPLDEVLPDVFWAWPKITTFVTDAGLSSGYVLDSALTGLPSSFCNYLDSEDVKIENIDLIVSQVTTPSLRSLKELQAVELKLRNFGPPVFPLSKVTVMAAFDQLPNVNVTIRFDHSMKYASGLEEYLMTIAPRVHLANLDDRINCDVRDMI